VEVAEGIHRIQAPLGDRFVCLYLLVGETGTLLLDTGIDDTPVTYLAPYMAQIGVATDRIRYVLNSHSDYDHTAGNLSVRELSPGACFMCHTLDLAMVEDMERILHARYDELGPDHGFYESDEGKAAMRATARTTPVDVALSGGERIRLEREWWVEVWHTPGHSRGHITLHDPRSGSLIICDAALYHAVLRADGEPAFPPTYRFVDSYVATLQRLEAAEPTLLLTSHYPIYDQVEAADFLAESRAFVERVDDALLAALRNANGGRTLRQLVEELGPRLGAWPVAANPALSQPLYGHLERMTSYGLVRQTRAAEQVKFELV
jgi:glyoxylase-like metal-dependent hydrolase (beta-lactamase superfamily II)